MLDGKKVVRERVFAFVDKTHIGHKYTSEVFQRINELSKKAKDIPTSKTLSNDPKLSDSAKDVVLTDLKPFSVRDLDSALETVEKFRKGRVATSGIEKALKQIVNESNPDKAESLLEKTIFNLRSRSRNELVHGKEHVKLTKQITREKLPNLVKTGFSYFDKESGGFPRSGVVILSAPPGGMKTTMAISMATNQFLHYGEDVCIASLEMSKKEIIERQLAGLARVPFSHIYKRIMTPKQKTKVIRKSKLIRRIEKKNGNRFSIFSPDDDVTFSQLMNTLSPFGYKIIYIDYINLLSNDDASDDWKHLREMTRLAKRMAKKMNCCIVLLAQLSEESGKIRYSGGIRENCLVGDSLINTEKGLVRLDSIERHQKPGTYVTNNFCNSIDGKTFIGNWHKRTGKKHIWTLTTSRGYRVESTDTHKILTLGKDLQYMWKPQALVKAGSYIAIQRSEYLWPKKLPSLNFKTEDKHCYKKRKFKNPKKLSMNLCSILGYLVAEGMVATQYNKGSINYIVEFANANQQLITNFVYSYSKVFGYEPDIQKGKNNVYHARVVHKESWQFFNYLNIGAKSRNKRIPECVMQAPKRFVAEFLRCYFEGDGWVGNNGRSVHCVTYSKELASQIHVLLLQFGIVSKLSKGYDNYKGRTKLNKKSHFWNITMTGKDAYTFGWEIGFITKNSRLKPSENNNTNIDVVPYLLDNLKARKKGQNRYIVESGKSKMLKLFPSGYTDRKEFSYDLLYGSKEARSTIAKEFPELSNKLERILKDNFFWDKVISNRYSGEKEVYDLSTFSHSYVANGIVVHNCDNWWRWYCTRDDKEAGFITIEQPKARNGPEYEFRIGISTKFLNYFDVDQEESIEKPSSEKSAKKQFKDTDSNLDMDEEEF